MNSLYMPDYIYLEVYAGSDISDALTEAIEVSKLINKEVKISFNGVKFILHKHSNIDECYSRYLRELKNNSQTKRTT